MDATEIKYAGANLFHWPDTASVAANIPRIFETQRVHTSGGVIYCHGVSRSQDGPQVDAVYGDPLAQGYYPHNRPPLPLSALPAEDTCTLRPLEAGWLMPTFATVARDGAFTLPLAFDTWTALTGGIDQPIQGASYNGVTGELTVTNAGTYLVSISVSMFHTVSLSAPGIDVTVIVNGVSSALMARTTLADIVGTENVSCSCPITLPAGAVLVPCIRSSLALGVSVTDFVLGLWA